MSATPLSGLRVVEMEAIGPLLHAGMMLADLGAEVVRVVRPAGGAGDDGVVDPNAALLRGRVEVEVDLKDPDARTRLTELVAGADVLLEGFRPGTMERLGLAPETCRATNPGLVYARMTGWGQDGPLAHTAGHDINYLAVAGALEPMGPSDAPPVPPLNYVGNFGGGSMYLLVGVLAALQERERTGQGQVVDVAMLDGASSLTTLMRSWALAGRWQSERGTNLLDGSAPFYRSYACADGRFVAVGALEDEFYVHLVTGLGLDVAALPDRWDRRSWPALTETIGDVFATRTRDEWGVAFADSDACVSPVLTMDEAPAHPHAAARRSFATIDDAAMPSPAPRFGGPAEPAPPRRFPTLDDVLAGWKAPVAR